MGCTFKARLNQLWSIWYTILILTIQSYLLYLGFERYKLYNEMKWPAHGGYPHIWLTVYVVLYAVCIPGSLLFFAFGVFKSGNIPGDNEKLADREERIIEVTKDKHGEKQGCLHGLKSLWQHLPPIPQQLHVKMALCQLIAQQLMIAQLYRNGFINSGDFLNTELDFVYQRARQLATNLPIGETKMQGFSITSDRLSSSPLAPNLLPILMHFRLFGIPLEFVNLAIALIAYACAYPSVFWRVSKPFSLVFSFHLIVYAITLVYSYLGFSILFRIQETNHHSVRPVGLGQYLIHSRHLPFYHPYTIIATFVAATVLTTMAPIALYTYGYNKYFVNLLSEQAKNNTRTGQSDYTDYSRRRASYRSPSSQLCCDGYGPHTTAIILLVLIVIAKAPTIYALMILYQHEEKPILLSCIIVDVVYLFTWIILWLILTLKRDWNFNVSHKVHQIYALQKGLTSGHVKQNENPSALKNALIVMHKDHMFVTDDQAAKQSLLRAVQRGDFNTEDGAYWQKQNGQQSPQTRKAPMEDQIRQTPEMSRLLAGRRPSDDSSQVSRSAHVSITQPTPPIQFRGNSSPPEDTGQNTFGTLQRIPQQATYMSTLQRNQSGPSGTLQRTAVNQWPTQQEAYASIHKAKQEQAMFPQRRGSQEEGVAYGQIQNNYSSTYGTCARLPPQSRIPVQPGVPVQSNIRLNGGNYGIQHIQSVQRRPSDGSSNPIGIRQSPLLGQDTRVASKEQSPYQRTAGVNLSSFNSADTKSGGSIYGSVPSQWGSQRATHGQPQQLLWNQNKSSSGSAVGTMSASSSQQDNQCFTPTSTLTSQGSNYSSQHTPTPGSPNTNNSVYGTRQPLYGIIGEDTIYGERTLQKQQRPTTVSTGTTSVRHAVKVVPPRTDDSANFSLSSSNGSQETTRAAVSSDFATSIV